MSSPKQPAKLAMLLLPLLLLLCIGVGDVRCAKLHENSVDLQALVDFRAGITHDPHGALSNWTSNSHFCRWNRVTCTTTRPFRVYELILSGLDLAGKITSSLGNLTFLVLLDLASNNFVGPIPMLDNLQELQVLNLSSNHLNGVIPHSLTNCSNLTGLDLSENSLAGVLPSELGLLSNLAYLDLSNNLLLGQIPPNLGLLQILEYVSLESNQLEGSIPAEIGQLLKLQHLALRNNKLSGVLP